MSFNLGNLQEEEKKFLAKMEDVFSSVRRKNILKYTAFLNERQQVLCQILSQQNRDQSISAFGGYDGAERVVICVMADYDSPEFLEFPIVPITIKYRKQDSLSHRDFLGALMNLRITRESIGDILVSEGGAVLFVSSAVAPIILDEIVKIGRVGVECIRGITIPLPPNHEFKEISDTVASLRLDCVVASGYNLSREKAANLIRSGQVVVNSINCENVSQIVSKGDKISAKGYGKFLLEDIGGLSKKGKTYITMKKYI